MYVCMCVCVYTDLLPSLGGELVLLTHDCRLAVDCVHVITNVAFLVKPRNALHVARGLGIYLVQGLSIYRVQGQVYMCIVVQGLGIYVVQGLSIYRVQELGIYRVQGLSIYVACCSGVRYTSYMLFRG